MHIIERHSILTEAQCFFLIETYRGDLQPSMVTSAAGRVRSSVRTGFSHKIPELRVDISSSLKAAVAEIPGTTVDYLERWEIVRYSVGEYFQPHLDWINPDIYKDAYVQGGQRTHSVIVYLSKVLKGGETFFPLSGNVIVPQIGMLAAWNNTENNKPCPKALHQALPVIEGEKWILVNWVRERAFPWHEFNQ